MTHAPRNAILLAVGIAVLIALPMVVKSSFAIDIFIRILLFSFIGTAWNLMGGYAKQLSLGHAAYFGLGAYTSTLLEINYNVSPWLGMIAGGVVAVLASLPIGWLCFRLRGPYFTIATIATAQALMLIFLKFRDFAWGAEGTTIPNLGAAPLPSAQGVKVIAVGEDKKSPARNDNLDVAADWALVRIAPPVTAVAPIPIGRFNTAEIDHVLGEGGELSQAGYGVYGLSVGQHLYQQGHCRRLDDDKVEAARRGYVLFTSCRPIKGDSGGPLILTKADGERYLVGVISEYQFTRGAAGRITIAAGALGFARDLASAQ